MKKSKLVIGISSRALFDLDESHKIFERDGVDAYSCLLYTSDAADDW